MLELSPTGQKCSQKLNAAEDSIGFIHIMIALINRINIRKKKYAEVLATVFDVL
jgi:hypothetical protein